MTTPGTRQSAVSKRPGRPAAVPPRKPGAARKKLAQPPAALVYDVAENVARMALEHVQCRDFGHSWRPFSARWLAGSNCFVEILQCARCATERSRMLGARGQLLSNRYVYADGYLVKGMGQLTGTDKDSLRLRSIQSILITDTVEE